MMMAQIQFCIKLFFFVLVTGWSLPCIGQTSPISGTVMKSNSSEVLPFVTIAVKNTVRGTVTDGQGRFTIDTNSSDSLIISSIGFKKRIILASQITNIIFIEEETKILNEVVVSSAKHNRKVDLGNLKQKTVFAAGGSNQYTKLFVNKAEGEGMLESITFSFQPEAKKYGRYMTAIMIRVYQNNNGLPGNDLLLEKVIIPIKENQKSLVVDLGMYNINFPAEGLFVGFDFVGFYDGSEIFTPYSKLKTPANLRVEFAKADSSDTFNKFFGTSWQKVSHTDRNGNKIPVSAKFAVRVIY